MSFNQIKLISAISHELSEQVPGCTVNPRQYNVIIAAANAIVREMETPDVVAGPAAGLAAWLASDETGASSLYLAYRLATDNEWIAAEGPHVTDYAHPHDAADFLRVRKMLDATGWKRRFLDMNDDYLSPEWCVVKHNYAQWDHLSSIKKHNVLYQDMKAKYKGLSGYVDGAAEDCDNE